MIPSEWMPHRRADGEVVGYIREVGAQFQPMDLFGRPLAAASDWLEAEEALEGHSLAWLTEPFLLSEAGREIRVRVVEVSPERIRVKTEDFGDLGAEQVFHEVQVPEVGILRASPPVTEWPPN